MFATLRRILTFAARLGNLEAANGDLEEGLKNVVRHLEELRGDLDWQAGELKKLRGRVTGGSRKPAEPQPEEGNGAGTIEDKNLLIKAGLYKRR